MDRMHDLLQTLADEKLTFGTVESLTGGKFAAEATRYPGASNVFKGALITYSAKLKTALAGVPEQTIAKEGVVSEAVAKAMAAGGRKALGVDLCIACTGNAGPTTEPGKAKVGDVYVSVAYKGSTWTVGFSFGEGLGRFDIREKTIAAMIEMALALFKKPQEPENPE